MTNDVKNSVKILRESGISFKEIAKQLSSGETTVRRYYRASIEHASEKKLYSLMPLFDKCMELLEEQGNIAQTPFALAMHDECKLGRPVESYRKYYANKAKQEVDKIVVYNVLVKRGCSPRRPALRFVWNKGTRPEWATFDTADKFLQK